MYCSNCNKHFNDDLSFCPSCGTPLQRIGGNAGRNPQGKKKNHLVVIISLIVVLLVVLLVGGIVLFKNSGGTKGGSDGLVWLNDSGYQFVNSTNLKEYEPITLDSVGSSATDYSNECGQFSPDGRYFYYISRFEEAGVGTLYRAELKSIRANKNNEKYQIHIDNKVDPESMHIYEDNTVLYKKIDSGSNNLCYYNGNEIMSIAKNIDSYQYFDKEVIFSKVQEDGSYILYYQNLNEEADPKEFVAGIQSFQAVDAGHVVCTGNFNEENNTFELYMAGKDRKPEKIAGDVEAWEIPKNQGEIDKVYYQTVKSNPICLADAVTYSGYQEDKNVKEPDTNNPLYYDKNDGWFGSYTDAYYEARDAYNEAQNRLSIMERLKEETYDLKTKALHYYDLEKEETGDICGNITACACDSEGGTSALVYMKGISTLQPVDITNQMEDSYSIREYVEEAIRKACMDKSALYFRIGDGEEKKVEIKDASEYENIDNFLLCFFDEGNKLAYLGYGTTLTEQEVFTNLYVADVEDSKVGEIERISYSVNEINKEGDTLIASNDSETYIYGKEGMSLFAEGDSVYYTKFYADGSIYYVEDYAEFYGGTLYKMDKNGKRTKIVDGVGSYSVLNNGNVIYLCTGVLKKYNGKDSVTIANDVDTFWSGNEKEQSNNAEDDR